MGYVEVRGQQLYYEEQGEGAPVVFSHGLFMDHTMFAPQLEAVARTHRAIGWDERGHGRTRTTAEPFSYWDSAEDLLGLLDALEIERATLVGMSQGGYLSMRAALLAPERVEALVLIDSQAGVEDPAARAGYDELIAAWEAHGLTDELAATIASIVIDPDPAAQAPWIERWRGFDTATVRQVFTTLATRDDITARLPEIAAPALVLHGDADLVIGLEVARTLAEALPNAELEIVPGGHGAVVTHPAPITAAIERFLA